MDLSKCTRRCLQFQNVPRKAQLLPRCGELVVAVVASFRPVNLCSLVSAVSHVDMLRVPRCIAESACTFFIVYVMDSIEKYALIFHFVSIPYLSPEVS